VLDPIRCTKCDLLMIKLTSTALMIDNPEIAWCQKCGAVVKIELERTSFGRTRRTWLLPDEDVEKKTEMIKGSADATAVMPGLQTQSSAALLAQVIAVNEPLHTCAHVQKLLEKAIDERIVEVLKKVVAK